MKGFVVSYTGLLQPRLWGNYWLRIDLRNRRPEQFSPDEKSWNYRSVEQPFWKDDMTWYDIQTFLQSVDFIYIVFKLKWAGVSEKGWNIRYDAGSPVEWTFDSVQIPRGHFTVLSMAYPPNTEFNVRIEVKWGQPSSYTIKVPRAGSLDQVDFPSSYLFVSNSESWKSNFSIAT